jgi:Uma2 family endonuclease
MGSAATFVRTRPITADDYARMVEAGIVRHDERVELLNGRIIEMPPIGPSHAYTVDAATAALFAALGPDAVVRTQGPLKLSRFSWLQPDIAVLRGPRSRYMNTDATARDVLLVIEVADSSFPHDCGEKLAAYARACIAEYWIVDLQRSVVHAFADPAGDTYRTHRIADRDEQIALRAIVAPALSVAALLPESSRST